MTPTDHKQRDAVMASFLIVPGHEVYRSRRAPPEEKESRPPERGENWASPSVLDRDIGEW